MLGCQRQRAALGDDPIDQVCLVPNQALRARLGPTMSSRGLSKAPSLRRRSPLRSPQTLACRLVLAQNHSAFPIQRLIWA
ncbi:hypothetical protein DB30_00903 [Enhygromyxa salina]|uniref:Uncharacterized protein n=1 Tax=Enhygromyxa salina TaxID=215803 RepID=A0A0C2CYK8_9BACT|nr:hypothetical protein DB30_00903 [Enhygromyxa salina]